MSRGHPAINCSKRSRCPANSARVASSKLKELVITDSILPPAAVRAAPNIRVISIATLIGEAIERTASEESVSSLFD